ncbi:MAG: protein kinase [Candidatus Eremiobacteraeota bacterium]|nr:protein kinase [Candidatus Eremiobacteraeota bacterium]
MSDILKIGNSIKEYEITRVLGKSDISAVYQVKDSSKRGRRILKEVRNPENQVDPKWFTDNFNRISGQLSTLKHNAISNILDYFVQDDRFYFVREDFEGRSLKDFIEKHTEHFTEEQVLNWAFHVMDVITYLHSQKTPVLMGVIIPKNLILSPMGKVRIMSLGLARYFPLEQQRKILKEVSPGYTAPEIFLENGTPTKKGDVYSLGVLLHFFFTRKDPNKHPMEFKNIDKYRADVSERTCKAIEKALSKNPDERFESVEEFKNSLMGEFVEQQKPKLKCSIDRITVENAPQESLLEGDFYIENAGGGELSGVIYVEYTWLKIQPNRFQGDENQIHYWIDTIYMQPESLQENTISIQTPDEKVDIPVTVNIAPGTLRSMNAFVAGIVMIMIPIFFHAWLEAFRAYIQKTAWQMLLKHYYLADKGMEFVIQNRKILITKMKFPTEILLMCKAYAGLFLLLPYFCPLIVGKFWEKLRPEIRRKTQPIAIFAMLIPSILLIAGMFIHIFPPDLLANSVFQYIDYSYLISPFILINFLTIMLMALPKDDSGLTAIDRNGFIKTIYYLIYVAYFVYIIIFFIVK